MTLLPINEPYSEIAKTLAPEMSRERMNSSPDYMGQQLHPNQNGNFRPPRIRRRTMSIENTSLTEVITIYEKLKKTREQTTYNTDVFKPSNIHFQTDIEESDFEESVPLEPFNPIPGGGPECIGVPQPTPFGTQKVLDFNKFKNLRNNVKYLFFSSSTGLIQSDTLEDLKFSMPKARGDFENNLEDMNYVKLLKTKQYWLNILDPSEKDLALLGTAFNVHDLTLRDIREGNTEEKIEVYKHYMFMSLRLLSENDTTSQRKQRKMAKEPNHNATEDAVFLNVNDEPETGSQSSLDTLSDEKDPVPIVEDVDFNILLFSDFIITIHDRHWGSIKDVLGFLNLLCTYGNSPLTPDWVLFSIFIELAQDAKYSVNYMEPKILHVKVAETDSGTFMSGLELSRVLRKNFEYEFEIYKISRFVKPKMNILKLLKMKCNKRLSSTVIKLLSNICSEFEDLLDEINHFSHILERSQDTFLTMASVQQSLEANDMGKVMKRISEVALIFLPVQAVGGFLGMNVKVPFQDVDGTMPFWFIVLGSLIFAMGLYCLRKLILNQSGVDLSMAYRCFRCRRRQ